MIPQDSRDDGPGSPASAPTDSQAEARFHAAWLAHTRQELETPALAVREYIQLFRDSLPVPTPRNLEGDVAKLGQYGERLAEQVQRFFDTSLDSDDPDPLHLGEIRRTIRHDLRSIAGFIVSLCEVILEDQADSLSKDSLGGLHRITTASRRVITRIEELVRFSQTSAPRDSTQVNQELLHTLQQLSALPAVQTKQTGRILLVDDNSDNRDLYKAILVSQGHIVQDIADGKSALALLDQVGADVCDLVLLDVMMPGISGLEVLDRIKADPRFRHLPVVLMSALGEEEVMINSLLRGAEDYLRRPVSGLLLQARLSACLEKKRLRDRERMYQHRIDELLRALFPSAIVAELKESGTVQTRRHERIGVMFLDVVGFTQFCELRKDSPEDVVDLLQRFVRILEQTARRHGVQKIKTIGDAFMATAGLLLPDPDPVATLIRCAAEMIRATATNLEGWQVRIGIHQGAVVAGIVGETQFSYDIWGDTVNMAARIESSGRPGFISLSSEAWEAVTGRVPATPRDVALRGIGPVVVWDIVPAEVPTEDGAASDPSPQK